MANEDLKGGAPEPALQLELVSGQYPTYAAMKRHGSELAVEEVFFHCGQDRRPGRRPDRTMMALSCRWMPTAPTVSRDATEQHGGASEPTGATGSRDAAELTEGAKQAAQSLADILEGQPKPTARRRARDGRFYTKEEFNAEYGEDLGHDRWEEADEIEEYEWGPNDVNSVLGHALWPRETPKMMMLVNGNILLAAATCPPAALIETLFKTLLRVRQADFEAEAGINNPDAWDTGAAERCVRIDTDRHLGEAEFGKAYARWRRIPQGW